MNAQAALKGHARRNYFIDKAFQSNFILKFCSLVAIGSGLMILILYFLAKSSTTVAFVNARVSVMTTADFIFPLLLQTVLVVMVFMSLASAAVMLFVSHKIAGPLFRFKATFQELAEGNFKNQVKLRQGDQLHELAVGINKTITAVRAQARSAQDLVEAAKLDIDAITEFNVEDSKRKRFIELRQKISELEKVVSFFKL